MSLRGVSVVPPTTSFPAAVALPRSPAGLLCTPAIKEVPLLPYQGCPASLHAALGTFVFALTFSFSPFLDRANFYQHYKYFPHFLFPYKRNRETIKTKSLFCRALIFTDLTMAFRAEPFVTHISLQNLQIGLLCTQTIAQAKANKAGFLNKYL